MILAKAGPEKGLGPIFSKRTYFHDQIVWALFLKTDGRDRDHYKFGFTFSRLDRSDLETGFEGWRKSRK